MKGIRVCSNKELNRYGLNATREIFSFNLHGTIALLKLI